MKKFIVSICMLSAAFNFQSQELPKVIPASPEASSLAKFVDVPVSHYTGVPNISIPIYTIQQKEISIPISLSYHARGVLVTETAPRTGTGWSLQYGGSISRQIRGKADESAGFGYLVNGTNLANAPYNQTTRASIDGGELMDQGYDFYPDQFSFNAGGVSGKFILDYNNGNPIVQSFQDIKISYTQGSFHPGTNGIDSFKLIDQSGKIYYFGISKDKQRKGQDYQSSIGYSFSYGGNINPDPGSTASDLKISSWKLMDIETPNGEVISYFYEGGSSASYYRKSYDKHRPQSETTGNSLTDMGNISAIQTRVSKVTNYERKLSKIEFNEGRDSILFIAQTPRLDFNDNTLDKISIYNRDNLIKSYNLNYSYTHRSDPDDASSMLSYIGSAYGNNPKRLFLASVEEQGRDGQKLSPYIFTYDPQTLPSMYSSRQDYWGYYNGAKNDPNNPSVTGNGPFTRMFEYGNFKPDRRVDTLKSEAGILKEIQYPTGGKAKFTYEHNKGHIPDGMMHLKKPQINPDANSTQRIILRKEDFLPYLTAKTITLPSSTNISYQINCNFFRDVEDTTTPDCAYDFRLNDSGMIVLPKNGQIVSYYTSSSNTGFTDISISIHPTDPTNFGQNHYLDDNFGFEIIIKYNDPDNPSLIYGPGKRIKKIEHIDEFGNSIFKEYEYVRLPEEGLGQQNTFPSGAIIGLPGYLNTGVLNSIGIPLHTRYYDATSSYSSFQPNSIGYSSVIEYHGTRESNIGRTEYTFTNISDTGGDYFEYPYHPPTDNEWLRGKNIRTKIYKKNENGAYVKVKEVYNKYLYSNIEFEADLQYAGLQIFGFPYTPLQYTYNWNQNHPILNDYQDTKTLFRLPMYMRKECEYWNVNCLDNSNWQYRVYHFTGGTQHLLRTVEKDYYKDILEKTTTYDYDYDKHYQVKSTETLDSDGFLTKSLNYYQTDVNSLTGLSPTEINAIGILNTNNRFEIVQTENYKDTILLSKLRKNYKQDYGQILTDKIQVSKGSQSLEDRILYDKYDSKGNPVEVSKKDGSKIYYVWGYNKTQPIAQIVGYSSISQTQKTKINDAILASNNDIDETTEEFLRTKLTALRVSFSSSSAQIKTYTYDPLIGVTSITDTREETMYYEYDSFNRLEFVKDADGNILNKTNYNYKK